MRIILQTVNENLPLDIMMFRNHGSLKESDSFLIDVLKLAIHNIESRASISILKKTWKIIHNNHYINLSYGPVCDILSMKNSKGVDLTPISKTRIHDNMMLTFEEGLGFITVFYTTGYDACNLPECLKNTIEQEFWKVYYDNESQLSLEKSCTFYTKAALSCVLG